VEVVVIPARVQGDGAAQEIAAGIELAGRLQPALEVLVVGRGGGSIEDLWPFNEEVVVRAIAASRIPTMSAVGHEIDVTLSDLVADVRALTPSEAAERLLPSLEETQRQVARSAERVHAAMRRRIRLYEQRLEGLASRRVFLHPQSLVEDRARGIDELEARARRAALALTKTAEHRLANLAGKLSSLSPLAVLSRGYTVTQDAATGRVLRSARSVRPGTSLVTRFTDGEVHSVVETPRKT
jgi:exodeoxyribonuclease VII large subunit